MEELQRGERHGGRRDAGREKVSASKKEVK